ncbi:MAG: type II toxin-antitoxin system HicB family antitoxin [Verrucomicrobiota bacterium]|nr:type II toxin-antitoxin system HicB family antitoxin [Verrucomicrobiota bacterium]
MKKIKASDYIRIVEWSEEDRCFIGSAPPLIGQCCHGKKEADVYRQLCAMVEEWVDLYNNEGKTLPKPSAGKDYSGKFVLRVGAELHRLLAVRALQAGDSLNNYCARLLKKTA